jgi:hypothetical protein
MLAGFTWKPGGNHWEDLGVYGRIILKYVSTK